MFKIGRKNKSGKDHNRGTKRGTPNRKKDRSRMFIMLGLALGMLLASLDQTVVGTVFPRIASVMGGMELFSWLFTAYMLAETIVIPIAGKMSDRVGRKPVFLAGMGVFMAGSLIAGFSASMEMLIACRFIQGIGAGALIPVAMATVADLYAPQDRGKIQGILGAVFALSAIIGPLIGGLIVDHMDWHWVFWINLPVGVLAVLVASFKFPDMERVTTSPIDYLGILTLTTCLAPALLIMTWGGGTYAWDSVEIIGMAAISVVSLIAFIHVERRAADPLIPFHLFKEPILSLGSVGLFIIALGMFGVIGFLPLFLQAVMGMSASNSGLLTIPLMIGSMATSIGSGFLLKRTGYRPWLLIGPPLAALGMYLLSTLHSGSSPVDAILFQMIVGMGIGAVMSNYIVAAQNVVPKREMGVTTSTMSLFRSIGGTVGVTLFGAVLNGRMAQEIGHNLPEGAAALLPTTDATSLGNKLLDPVSAGTIPEFIMDAIRLSLGNSITYLFLIGSVIVLLALVASVFVRKVPLKSSEEYFSDGEQTVPTPAEGRTELTAATVPAAKEITEVPKE